jgi:hypothetical protein
VIVERKDANNIFYGQKLSPKEILSGSVVPPISCQPLYDELNLQSEEVSYNTPADTNQQPSYGNHQVGNGYYGQSLPQYENQPTVPVVPVKPKSVNSAYNSRYSTSGQYQQSGYGNEHQPPYGTQSNDRYQSTSTDRNSSAKYQYQSSTLPSQINNDGKFASQNEFGDFKSPQRPPKPPQRLPIAKALYNFDGERDTDLSLQVGDLVTVLKRGEDEWWTGRVGRREGEFPANYVRMEE